MANVFLDQDEAFTITEPAQVFGRNQGSETVVLGNGAAGSTVDANIERIDLPEMSSEYQMEMTSAGLEIVREEDATTVLTLPSLNQATDLRFADGNVTLQQTGAQTFSVTTPETETTVAGADPLRLSGLDGGQGKFSESAGAAVIGGDTGSFSLPSGRDVAFASGRPSYTINHTPDGIELQAADAPNVTIAGAQDESSRLSFLDGTVAAEIRADGTLSVGGAALSQGESAPGLGLDDARFPGETSEAAVGVTTEPSFIDVDGSGTPNDPRAIDASADVFPAAPGGSWDIRDGVASANFAEVRNFAGDDEIVLQGVESSDVEVSASGVGGHDSRGALNADAATGTVSVPLG